MLEEDNKFNTSQISIPEKESYFFESSRNQLPRLKDPNDRPSIFRIAKDLIGKDFTRVTLPVYLNEPVTFLQKQAEIFVNESLLEKASETEDPILRHLYVTMFCVGYAQTTIGRIAKPFNPLLGETHEMVTKKFKIMSEQVSHHPPISASYAVA